VAVAVAVVVVIVVAVCVSGGGHRWYSGEGKCGVVCVVISKAMKAPTSLFCFSLFPF